MKPIDSVLALVRPEILALTPYSSARKESSGGRVWLDANENPLTPHAGAPRLNRYPDPQPPELIARLASLYGVVPDRVLVTRGSDEGIDLLLRAFCRAGQDSIVITPPTYGMYAVAAGIQGAAVRSAPLERDQDFALDVGAVLAAVDASVKLVFLCSPNNPTGQLLACDSVRHVVDALAGRAIVVIDEAYGEFASEPSFAGELAERPNLVVLRTLSKAFGLAGARVGATLATPELIAVLKKIIAPYPIPTPVANAALEALAPHAIAAARRSALGLVEQRRRLAAGLAELPAVRRVWPSDANFLLVEVTDSARVMSVARAAGLILRDRSKDVPNTVRITVGSPEETAFALETLARA
ncbi:MAG: histidinol-phosphate transaminase [Opitutus sp.]|nr:histidinol-phosphate transaminase [Opitutus sp.]